MNKVTRLLGSAALATGLIFGGSTGVAFANDNNYRDSHKSSYDNRGDDRRYDGRNSYHNDYKYLYRCSSWRGHHHWYEWSDRYEHRRNCDFILKVRVRY
ncbi:putative uncharacterized protein [Pseudarthrobacter siccitolerans]|uniref:Uncharacterized protein n=1 Tax=Pseudarthrobacter siccitolerans TaxID=861266 RepID=A0A024H3D1_9MICC|nr:hypothetical protein [Pseudarthrobacter siccitolerans]CCQ46685.1 putative uncharacterized protein [Pseudarthrobacter siccitolerans]